VVDLFGDVYVANTAGGATSKDAYKSLGIVVGWIVLGAIWVALNPAMRGKKVLHDPGRKDLVAVA
jgi:hypothetical protein